MKDVQEICPDAWIINFTNPAGMVTEAVYRLHQFQTLYRRGCNIPIGMKMFITDVLQLSPSDELNIDLFGLNHLVFVRDVLVNGVSRFDGTAGRRGLRPSDRELGEKHLRPAV